jgi:hypothetical protein
MRIFAKKLSLTKKDLDKITTLLGLVAGISGVLGANDVINSKTAGTIGGIATVCLGYLVQYPTNKEQNF